MSEGCVITFFDSATDDHSPETSPVESHNGHKIEPIRWGKKVGTGWLVWWCSMSTPCVPFHASQTNRPTVSATATLLHRLWDAEGVLLHIGSAFEPAERCTAHRDKP